MFNKGTVHFVVQGKGGVGKSLVSTLLYQYLKSKETEETQDTTKGIDIDQVNTSFGAYAGKLNISVLKQKRKKVLKSNEMVEQIYISPEFFDEMLIVMEEFASKKTPCNIIVDVGASIYRSFLKWFVNYNIVNILNDVGFNVVFHCILAGGAAWRYTTESLTNICINLVNDKRKSVPADLPESIPGLRLYVWVNPFFGDFPVKDEDGSDVDIEHLRILERFKDLIGGKIYLPDRRDDTLDKAVANLYARRQTFEEGINDIKLGLVERQRLKIWWGDLYETLDEVGLV